MTVYKIIPDYNLETKKGLSSCTEKDVKNIAIWFEEAQPGESILVQIMEMSEEEYNKLPEYMGP